MKRKITALWAAALMCIGTPALAADADYNAGENAVSVDASAYQTVIITKDGDTTNDGIVYVNQTDSGTFGATMNFLLKANPAPGYYTMTLGGAEGTVNKVTNFYIGGVKPNNVGSITTNYQYKFEETSEEGYKDIAFTWDDVDGGSAKSIIVEIDGKGLGWDLTGMIDGQIMIGVQIKGVPEDVDINEAYISSKRISELTA